MSSSIHSISEFVPSETFKKSSVAASTNSYSSLGMWVIGALLLALLGFNLFYYLAKGLDETAGIIEIIFGPILRFFGYGALLTGKEVVENTAEGTKESVDALAETTTNAIDSTIDATNTTNTNGTINGTNVPNSKKARAVQNARELGEDIDQWQKDSLSKALNDAKQTYDTPLPDDSRSSIQTIGKAGWCYIGDDQGIRTCSEIGVNDMCMSGDVYPTQAVCMNPNLRA